MQGGKSAQVLDKAHFCADYFPESAQTREINQNLCRLVHEKGAEKLIPAPALLFIIRMDRNLCSMRILKIRLRLTTK